MYPGYKKNSTDYTASVLASLGRSGRGLRPGVSGSGAEPQRPPRRRGVRDGAPKARRSRGARGGAPEKNWCFSCDFFNFRRRFDPYRRPCCCCLHREIDKQKGT